MGRTYAVIDVGSNTIHLLVGEVVEGSVVPVTDEKVSVRLGAGVEETGRIEEERLRIATGTIDLFARISAMHGVERPEVIATSAVRDAENGRDLIGAVRVLTGLDVRLLSGEEEATVGFRGAMSATRAVSEESLANGFGPPVVVVDLGGGSAQLILGDMGGPEREVSLPLGSNRMTERFVASDPPSPTELDRVREYVLSQLPDWELPEDIHSVAIGGSARAMVRVLGHSLDRANARPGSEGQESEGTFTRESLRAVAAEVGEFPSAVYSRERGLGPLRSRVLPAAAATLEAMLEGLGLESFTVARAGLREGAILTLALNGTLDETVNT